MIEESFVRKLMASIKCSACGQHYEEPSIEIVERSDDLWFIKVVCSSCHVSCWVAIIVREEKRPCFVTDLTEAEIEKFRNMNDVNENDLLDMHDFLRNFDGDFPRIFDQQ